MSEEETMYQTQTREQRSRSGFTLIELLMVIAIIAILVSLTSAAVIFALNRGTETTTRTEIGQFEAGLASVRQAFNVDYLPSKLTLASSLAAYPNRNVAGNLDQVSVTFLYKMFGKRLFQGTTVPNWGTVTSPASLEGQELLVFYLGGIPDATGARTGFSNNPTDPTVAGGTRKGPYFDFKPARLQPTTRFARYLDPYGTPYAYFSSGPAGNDYNTTDCASLGLVPYSSGTQYISPKGVQIISAGPDRTFGTTGQFPVSTSSAGADDIANFSKTKLGLGLN